MDMAQRRRLATIIAIAFHLSGFIAMGIFKAESFIALTPLNMLVCAALILWTQEHINQGFIIFCGIAYITGFVTEGIGVNTGILFGNYSYGAPLGWQWKGIPFIIGVQWMVVMYCVGVCMHMLHARLLRGAPTGADAPVSPGFVAASTIIDGALLAVFFDWILEPVAIQLGYWTWEGDAIPMLNYITWFGVSVCILIFFHFLRFPKHNLFALHLLMIQVLFFLLMRAFG